jgi:putative ABC transport system substrate-binding protein
LKDAVPKVARVAVLDGVPSPSDLPSGYPPELEAAARALGVTLQWHKVQGPDDFVGAFAAMSLAKAEGLIVSPSPLFSAHIRRLADLSAEGRLPSIFPYISGPREGGLMSYAASELDTFRRLAIYAAKILNGAKPGDLPVEQPTKFELIINLKTAQALGLTIPASLLHRADGVIQ